MGKNIAVIAPAFSADCIETLEEINEEIKESFEEAGGSEFLYISCLNEEPSHIGALCKIIEEIYRVGFEIKNTVFQSRSLAMQVLHFPLFQP